MPKPPDIALSDDEVLKRRMVRLAYHFAKQGLTRRQFGEVLDPFIQGMLILARVNESRTQLGNQLTSRQRDLMQQLLALGADIWTFEPDDEP